MNQTNRHVIRSFSFSESPWALPPVLADRCHRVLPRAAWKALRKRFDRLALLDGAAVAVVPLDLYRQMVTGLAQAVPPLDRTGRAAPGQATAGKGSTVERDAEVAAFLRDLFPRRLTVAQLRAACLEKFGAERTPSLTRISVFRRRVT